MNNITTSIQEWITTTCASYKSEQNVSQQIPNIEQATGFVLEENTLIAVDGITLNLDTFFLNDLKHAGDLIKQIISSGHQIFIHAAINISEKDYSGITEQDKNILKQAEDFEKNGDHSGSIQLRNKWNSIIESLPLKNKILLTAAIKPNWTVEQFTEVKPTHIAEQFSKSL